MHRNIDFYMQTHGWVLADRLEHSHTRPRSPEKEKWEAEAESQTHRHKYARHLLHAVKDVDRQRRDALAFQI